MACRRCVSTSLKVLEHGSRIHAALAQLLFHQRQVFTNEIQIKHGNSLLYRKTGRAVHACTGTGHETRILVLLSRGDGASDFR